MVPLTHSYIDILTNAVALIPIYRFVVSQDYPGAVLCCLTFLSTIGSAYINRVLKARSQNELTSFSNSIRKQQSFDDTFARYTLVIYLTCRYLMITNSLVQPVIIACVGLVSTILSKTINKNPILHAIMNVFFYGTIAYTI